MVLGMALAGGAIVIIGFAAAIFTFTYRKGQCDFETASHVFLN